MRPLAGRTVLVTRPAHQTAALVDMIDAAGGVAFAFPALDIEVVPVEALAAPLAQLRNADIAIFISPNAAQFGMAAIQAGGGLPAATEVFAVGPGTARALRAAGVSNVITPGDSLLPNPDGTTKQSTKPASGQVAAYPPQAVEGANVGLSPPTPINHDSEALLALPQLQDMAGKRVVIVRGVGGRALLADTLTARGAEVHFLECYRRVRPQVDAAPLLARWQAGGIDAVTVTSAETLRNLAALLGEAGAPLLAGTPLFAPHEKIAEAARRFGIARVIATPGGDAGLMEGLLNWFRNENRF
ncbi:MAG: uroporphyrinogen-III synthase [Gammaproteobacteria bacterium]|nr:uroporphyrinogen-III synthase [Gammaproteobacteria bacterium]MBU1408625.1 uroporphyrinogen-III synthase [Gammaproteobacteria bacterium]MBU1532437.1 uroporphyrinogen-III synthase [Gammaproteobacteria bacterium]